MTPQEQHELRNLSLEAGRLATFGKLYEAIDAQKELIRSATELTANPRDIEEFYNRLASLYLKTGQHALAEDAARETLKLHLQCGDCGRETTRLGDYYLMLSKTLEAQNRFAEAADAVEKGLPIFRDLIGEDSSLTKGIAAHLKELKENVWRG